MLAAQRGNLDNVRTLIKLGANVRRIDSEGITQLVTSFSEKGTSQLFFVIGGASGFPKQLTLKAKKIIALSKMVFPHKVARLILVEQLYRAKCIINRHPYHKA